MTKFDDAELERIVSEVKTLPQPTPRSLVQTAPISKHRLAAAKMLEATLAKAGLDVAEFNKLMAQDQREARELFENTLAKPSADAQAVKTAHRQRVEAYAKAGKLLTPDFPPPQVIQIPEPFYISAEPKGIDSTIFTGGSIAPNDSYIKIAVDTNADSDTGIFTFWYIWSNDSNLDLIITAVGSTIVNGTWYLEADPGYLWGLLGSDSAYIQLQTTFQTLRYSGWGTDPVTGQSLDNTLYPLPNEFYPTFSSEVPKNGSYGAQGDFQNLFSQASQGPIVVPPGAVAVFLVDFILEFGFQGGGGNTADLIKIDLNSMPSGDGQFAGYGVFCPAVWLEVWAKYFPLISE
jgi:hypothetical protein